MKKIVFMVINMNVGGTEKALLNMIAEMPIDEYEITILMLEKYGGFLKAIPKHVHKKYLEEYPEIKDILNNPPGKTIKVLLAQGKLLQGLSLFFVHLQSKITSNRSIFFKYILKDVPNLKGEYDIAVAYAGPMDFISYFVVKRIKAQKKIQWIHFDITKIAFNVKFAKKIYYHFDKLYIVSEEARNKLINKLPSLQEETEVFLNIVSPNKILSQANEGNGFTDNFDGLRILTVGRLAMEKGQDTAIKALARLKKEGYKVRWYCIGDGGARHYYEKLIDKYGLHDSFILLGPRTNPYPYMDQCDIYVQPSKYEGYCITLIEARSLSKPIVTTDVNGAREQITHGETGLITDNNEMEICNAIKKLINDEKLRNKFKNNLFKMSVYSKAESKTIYGSIKSVF